MVIIIIGVDLYIILSLVFHVVQQMYVERGWMNDSWIYRCMHIVYWNVWCETCNNRYVVWCTTLLFPLLIKKTKDHVVIDSFLIDRFFVFFSWYQDCACLVQSLESKGS